LTAPLLRDRRRHGKQAKRHSEILLRKFNEIGSGIRPPDAQISFLTFSKMATVHRLEFKQNNI